MDSDVVFACLVVVVLVGGAAGGIVWAVVALGRARRRAGAMEMRLEQLERQVAALAAGGSGPAGRGAAAAPYAAATPATASASAVPTQAAAPPSSSRSLQPPAARPPGAPDGPPSARAASPAAPDASPAPASSAASAAPRSGSPTSRWAGIEEHLGARLPVWLGAVALALAGAFLVKYSVEQGWIGPTVRVGLAAGFGAGLLIVARLLRRSARPIAAALAAASVAVLYATVLAAVQLYGLLPAAAGFALMALITAGAVGLALVFGPIVAVVGIVGGFLTPYWVHIGDPNPKRLFAYLLLLHVAVVAVSRRRSWPALSAVSLAGGFLWVTAFLAGGLRPGDGPWMQLFLLVSLAAWAAAQVAGRAAEDGPGAAGAALRIPLWAAAGAALVSFAVIISVEGFGPLEWGLLGLLVAALLVARPLRGRLRRPLLAGRGDGGDAPPRLGLRAGRAARRAAPLPGHRRRHDGADRRRRLGRPVGLPAGRALGRAERRGRLRAAGGRLVGLARDHAGGGAGGAVDRSSPSLSPPSSSPPCCRWRGGAGRPRRRPPATEAVRGRAVERRAWRRHRGSTWRWRRSPWRPPRTSPGLRRSAWSARC